MDTVRYIVEWLTDVAESPDDGITRSEIFATLAEARAKAKAVQPLDYWDCPMISEEHLICDGHRRVWDWVRNHALD